MNAHTANRLARDAALVAALAQYDVTVPLSSEADRLINTLVRALTQPGMTSPDRIAAWEALRRWIGALECEVVPVAVPAWRVPTPAGLPCAAERMEGKAA